MIDEVFTQGIGNGLPLAAVVTTPEIAATLATRLHFNTFGGNPVCCAGGRAVLRAIDEDGIQANAAKVSQTPKTCTVTRFHGCDQQCGVSSPESSNHAEGQVHLRPHLSVTQYVQINVLVLTLLMFLPSSFPQVGAHLLQRLRGLQAQHDVVGDVRGQGLMIGVDMVKDRATKAPAKEETAQVGDATMRILQGWVASVVKLGPHV